MRMLLGAGFGLVALLVVIFIVVWISGMYETRDIKVGEQMSQQATQIAGRGQNGGDAMHSFETVANMRGGTLQSLKVQSVQPGGAMADYYGLQPGDEIVTIGEMNVSTYNDEKLAKAMAVQDGFEKKKPIVVRRNGVELTLPADKNATTANPPASTTTPPTGPATPNTVQNQLKNLGIQTH